MPAKGRWSREIACHGPRSHQGTSSLPPEGSHHIRRVAGGRSIARGCHRRSGEELGLALRQNSGQRPYQAPVIPTYLDGSFELEQNRLRNKDLTSLSAQVPDLSLEQLDLLSWTTATDLQEAVDYGVQINVVLICHGACVGRQKLPEWWWEEEEGWTRRRGWDALGRDRVLRSQEDE